MPSITGATRLIKYLKHEKAKRVKNRPFNPEMECYKRRDRMLQEIGLGSYHEYLKSDDWMKLRDEVLDKHNECRCCGKVATQLHHWTYDVEVILGIVPQLLIPLCRGCHEFAEFEDGEKVSLERANERLLAIAQRQRSISARVRTGFNQMKMLKVAKERAVAASRKKKKKDRKK